MPSIQIKRASNEATILSTALKDGEFAYAKDTNKLYIGTNGTAGGNVLINPEGGVAESAAKLAVARAFSISGDGTASAVNFDGSANVDLVLSLAASGVSAGTYTKVLVDEKGRVTQGYTLEVNDLPNNIPVSKITGLGTAATVNVGTEQGQIPVLGEGGKLPNTALPDMSTEYVPVDKIGEADGLATLGSDGKVPTEQLPSYVDDVVEAYVVGDTPFAQDWLSEESAGAALTPEGDKIYVVVSEGEYQNLTYRWGGSQYVEISNGGVALGTTHETAFYGDYGNTIYNATVNGKALKNSPTLSANDVGADPAGSALGVLGDAEDTSADATVYGAKALAQEALDAAQAASTQIGEKVATVTAGDGSVSVDGSSTNPTVAVKVSSEPGNALTLEEDGLFAAGATYTAGNGINISDNTISAVVAAGNGLSLTASGVTMAVATTSTYGAVRSDNTSIQNNDGVLTVGDIDCGVVG